MIEQVVRWLEKNRLPTWQIAAYIAAVGFLRLLLECVLFGRSQVTLAGFVHFAFFFTAVFLVGCIVISALSKVRIRKVVNVVASGYWVVSLVPLIDHLVFGRVENYQYIPATQFLGALLSPTVQAQYAGYALLGMLYLICLLSALYVLVRSRSVLRAVATGVIVYGVMFVSAAPALFVVTQSSLFSRNVLIAPFFMLVSVAMFYMAYWMHDKHEAVMLFWAARPFRSVFAIGLALGGLWVGGAGESPMLVLCALAAFFMWQFSFFVEKDKWMAVASAVLALAAAALINKAIGWLPLLVVAAFLVSAIMYCLPPFEFRKTVVSQLVMGWGFALTFLLGHFFSGQTITNEIATIALVVFFVGMAGTAIKDLKDYKADKKAGRRNLFTVLGMERGKKVATVLLGASFMLPYLVLSKVESIPVLAFFAALVMYDFWKNENVKRVILYAVAVLSLSVVWLLL